jgi:FMN phosphatase YigB (HAD superfamily)
VAPARTLFVDDLFANVRGARAAGLHAETVRDGRGLGKVLKRYAVRVEPSHAGAPGIAMSRAWPALQIGLSARR